VFVDSSAELKSFSPAKYFQTHPSLVDRTFNRPRLTAESSAKQPLPLTPVEDEATLRENERLRLRRYRELQLRLDRQRELEKAMRELEIQKLLMTQKGQRRKVGTDENGNSIYKWRAERRK
jgi:U3 small nucleolar RNA-associated protein 11